MLVTTGTSRVAFHRGFIKNCSSRRIEKNVIMCPGLSKVVGCWRKSPPTWLVFAGFSAWHFFTDDVI